MKNDKKSIPSLSDLIDKFSQQDVIAEMEKEYQSAPARLIPSSLLDDNSILKDIPVPKKTIEYFSSAIKEKGVYNPLVVRPVGDRYEVVLGRKRFYGAKSSGIISIPCVILELGDEEMFLMLLADSRDQKELNVVEMAQICAALRDKFHYTHQTLANISFQARSQITNILRILKLPLRIRKMVVSGEISYGHARALAGLKEEQIEKAFNEVISKKLSVRETEELSSSIAGDDSSSVMEKALENKIKSSKVKVGKTSITIKFENEQALNSFINRLQKDI